MVTKRLTLAVITATSILVSTSASAWWNDDNDYWDRGPWGGGYPGYGGWGGPGYGGWGGPGYGGWGGPGYGGWGGPGYGGWGGGYPGYGGWGAAQPRVIYTQPQGSGSSQDYRIR
jgi:hypothetical protein